MSVRAVIPARVFPQTTQRCEVKDLWKHRKTSVTEGGSDGRMNRIMSFIVDLEILNSARVWPTRRSSSESGAPVMQPITRNLKLSQGSLPMKSQLCSRQHINLPHKIHQSFSPAALRCHFTLPSYLMLKVSFGLGAWFPMWGTRTQPGSLQGFRRVPAVCCYSWTGGRRFISISTVTRIVSSLI